MTIKIFDKYVIYGIADFVLQVVSERCRIARRSTFLQGKALSVSFARLSNTLVKSVADFVPQDELRPSEE